MLLWTVGTGVRPAYRSDYYILEYGYSICLSLGQVKRNLLKFVEKI